MSLNWETLTLVERNTWLEANKPDELAKKFGKPADYFKSMTRFLAAIPKETKKPTPKVHEPPKELVISARRDLSFYEANFELFDNSVDAWRRNGATKDLHIEVDYDHALSTGIYSDDAGGIEEADVYKVFIPGATTNDDFDQNVIGSFGMGAKKAIFRLTDGAKIVSCTKAAFSATSEVPEKWESNPRWDTLDGRAKATKVGRTELYFFRLWSPPGPLDIAELIKRTGVSYRPLLTKGYLNQKIIIKINGNAVEPALEPQWSGAEGAKPRTYKFEHTFKDLAGTGEDIKLKFTFTSGLTRKSAGQSDGRDEDWGIDVFGNGRVIERFRKTEFGFGDSNMSMQSPGMKYFRAELDIEGHSLGIPWDTHKREYLKDHVVSKFLRVRLKPILTRYASIGNSFGGDTEKRKKFLEGLEFKGKPEEIELPAIPDEKHLPKYGYAKKKRGNPKPKPKPQPKPPDDDDDDDDDNEADVAAAEDDEVAVTLTMTRQERGKLYQRFGVSDEDKLAERLAECLDRGVTFSLKAGEFKKGLEYLKCEDATALSERLKDQLLGKLK